MIRAFMLTHIALYNDQQRAVARPIHCRNEVSCILGCQVLPIIPHRLSRFSKPKEQHFFSHLTSLQWCSMVLLSGHWLFNKDSIDFGKFCHTSTSFLSTSKEDFKVTVTITILCNYLSITFLWFKLSLWCFRPEG